MYFQTFTATTRCGLVTSIDQSIGPRIGEPFTLQGSQISQEIVCTCQPRGKKHTQTFSRPIDTITYTFYTTHCQKKGDSDTPASDLFTLFPYSETFSRFFTQL